MPNEPLTSWKAIAAVFNRDVRTVQRWEKEEGLPVHRHLHQRRHSVWAEREELESWWRDRGSQLSAAEDPPPASGDLETGFEPPSRPTRPMGRRRLLLHAAFGAAAIALAAAVLMSRGRASAHEAQATVTQLGSVPGVPNIDVRTLRDLNGDGADDLLLQSAPGTEVRLYFGPRSTPAANPDVRVMAAGQHHLYAAPVGDVDGDGFRDLAFNVMYDEPETYHDTGPTYLVRGRADWPSRLDLPRDADSTLYLDPGPDIRLMACSADDGVDLNRDGLADLVVGGGDYSPPDRRSAGGAFVFFGRRVWPARIKVTAGADVTVHGSHTGQGLSASCGAGDFNADGLTDLALVATDHTLWGLRGRRGSVFVFAGRAVWPAVLEAERDALVRLASDHPSIWLAQPRLVDVNDDGIDDLVAAMMGDAQPGFGRLAIVLGSSERRGEIRERAADVRIEEEGTFGHALATADIDGDGRVDLLVSNPSRGALHVIPNRLEWEPRGAAASYSSVIFTRKDRPLSGHHFAVGDADHDSSLDVALGIGADGFGIMTPALNLIVDVRPEASPNVLVPGGVVAISVRLDGVAQEELDLSSLRAGGASPTHYTWAQDRGSVQIYLDVNRLRLPPNATHLTVVGRTRSGVPVSGSDTIVMPARTANHAR